MILIPANAEVMWWRWICTSVIWGRYFLPLPRFGCRLRRLTVVAWRSLEPGPRIRGIEPRCGGSFLNCPSSPGDISPTWRELNSPRLKQEAIKQIMPIFFWPSWNKRCSALVPLGFKHSDPWICCILTYFRCRSWIILTAVRMSEFIKTPNKHAHLPLQSTQHYS